MSVPSSTGPQRRHPLAECEKCPLFNEESIYVPSSGPRDAKVAVVGEAPGVQEAQAGVPFTGPSGHLLNTVLEHHGLRRDNIFVTNACLCRPKNNATPGKTAIRSCWPRLKGE